MVKITYVIVSVLIAIITTATGSYYLIESGSYKNCNGGWKLIESGKDIGMYECPTRTIDPQWCHHLSAGVGYRCYLGLRVNESIIYGFEKIEECKIIYWNTTETIYDYINATRDTWGSCQKWNEFNQTWDSYACVNGSEVYMKKIKVEKVIEHNRNVCEIIGYDINDVNVKFRTFGNCKQPEKYGDTITLICDSSKDGNADGRCQSGESCIKYVFTGKDYTIEYKNSEGDFSTEKKSFIRPEKVDVKDALI